jgi:hypothetical protein
MKGRRWSRRSRCLFNGSSHSGTAGQHGKLEARPNSPIFYVDGQPWRWLACDLFAAPLLMFAGEDLSAVLAWVIATGFVSVRAFFALANIADQLGRPRFLATPDQTRHMLDLFASYGLRCEWTVGDMQMLLPDLHAQQDWYAAQAEVLKDYDLVTVETCNEPFKNGVDVAAIGRLGKGIMQTSGNYLPPCNPRLDYGVTHPPRDDEWPRKAKELFDLYNGFDPDLPGGVRIPWVNDEGMGSDEVNKPGSRSNVPDDFFDDGAVSALMGAGVTHHNTELVYARIPGPIGQQCAAATVAGANAIPVDAATGTYTRGGLNDSPLEHDDSLALRTFARIQGNKATAIVVRPKTDQRVPRNGWRIIGTAGPNHRIVYLER